jgi:hypothetical protein
MHRNMSMPINALKRSSMGRCFTVLRRPVLRRMAFLGVILFLLFVLLLLGLRRIASNQKCSPIQCSRFYHLFLTRAVCTILSTSKHQSVRTSTLCLALRCSLLLVSFEHVVPEGLDLLDVASLTINWDAGQWKAFCELAFETELLHVGTVVFLTIVFA